MKKYIFLIIKKFEININKIIKFFNNNLNKIVIKIFVLYLNERCFF